ncbi:MAG TPA: 4Fe-4S binding protein [Spirochaetota bacterium]|nr:4Fe-4S binding protein [Spirochaetota bacterium]
MESRNVLLIFNQHIMYKPIIYRIAKDFNVIFNVLEAKILPKQEGRLILQLSGEKQDLDACITYLKDEEVVVDILADKIQRDEDRCVHCGACTAVCRTDALVINRETMMVEFHPDRCVACGLCKLACPVKAMSGISIDVDSEELAVKAM